MILPCGEMASRDATEPLILDVAADFIITFK